MSAKSPSSRFNKFVKKLTNLLIFVKRKLTFCHTCAKSQLSQLKVILGELQIFMLLPTVVPTVDRCFRDGEAQLTPAYSQLNAR